MPPRHHVSPAAIALIKRFEGFRASAARTADGRWTIGHGHTRSARAGGRIDEADAADLLLYDLGEVCIGLNETIYTPLNQNQFDALASFAMNIGLDNFRTSAVLLRINEGALLQAATALEMWRRADFDGERIVVDALVRRRAAEKALFLTPTHGYVPAPSPVVRPLVDHGVMAAAPSDAAVELTARFDGEQATATRDPLGPEVTEPSPTQAAAIAVGARLNEILERFSEPDIVAPPTVEVARDPEPEPEPAPPPPSYQPVFGLRPTERTRFYDATQPPIPDDPEDAIDPSLDLSFHEPYRARFNHDAYDEGEVFEMDHAEAPARSAVTTGRLTLLVMLGVGIVLLGGGAFWFLSSHPTMGPIIHSVVGWLIGLTGVALMAGSIYLLLERVGGGYDD